MKTHFGQKIVDHPIFSCMKVVIHLEEALVQHWLRSQLAGLERDVQIFVAVGIRSDSSPVVQIHHYQH